MDFKDRTLAIGNSVVLLRDKYQLGNGTDVLLVVASRKQVVPANSACVVRCIRLMALGEERL